MSATATRVTHSCVLLDFAGHRVLTDPWFSEKPGYLRGEPLAYAPDELPPLAAVVASHDHYDHFDMDAFAAYPDKDVPFVVMRGMAAKARRAGFANVTEVEPWDEVEVGPLRITAAPARHGVPEVTYVLEGAGTTVYFGADTLRVPALDELAARFPAIDLALLPVNGLSIRPFNKRVVMTAEEAAELCATLRPAAAVPIHYAFTAGPVRDRLFLKYDGTPERFAAAAARLAPDTAVHVLAPGEPLEVA